MGRMGENAMRPIDVVRSKIDPDLLKYHATTLCEVIDPDSLRDVPGVGLCAWVLPARDGYNKAERTAEELKKAFQVYIIGHKFSTGWDLKSVDKFYVLVLNSGLDSPALSPGFFVPKSTVMAKGDFHAEQKEYIVTTR
jgi:hypothetical protein